MNVVIAGAGQVGQHAARVLSQGGHSITIVDPNPRALGQLADSLDLMTLEGTVQSQTTLRSAGVIDAGLYVAATNSDEINLLSASAAKKLGAREVMARVHNELYLEHGGFDYSAHLDIDHTICPERLTADAILNVLRNPGARVIDSFGRGAIQMQELEVSKDAKVLHRPLSDLHLHSRVGTIERGGEVMIPEAGAVLRAGDVVCLIGEPKTLEQEKAAFQPSERRPRRILIMGATPIGMRLAGLIPLRSFSVRLIEKDRERCEQASEELPEITVLQGDATDLQVLADEQLEEVDAFVATGLEDERNILTAMHVKSLGRAATVVVVEKGEFMPVIEHIGVDRVFSPRIVAASQIVMLVQKGPIRSMASLADGRAEVAEIMPEQGCRAIGKSLRELALPCVAAAIERDGKTRLPGPDDQVLEGDVLVVIAERTARKRLSELFA